MRSLFSGWPAGWPSWVSRRLRPQRGRDRGGGGGTTPGGWRPVVREAADALVDAGSSKARTSMEMATGGTRVTIRGEGVYDYRKRIGRLKVLLPQDPAGAPVSRPITELLAPGALFMKNRGAGVPADKWVRVDTGTLPDGNLVTGGVTDPFTAAELLRGARTATYVGRTELAGAPVRHYRGTADLHEAAQAASEANRRTLGAAASGFATARGPLRRLPRRPGTHPQGPAPLQLHERGAVRPGRGRLHHPALRLRRSGRRTPARRPTTSTRAGLRRSEPGGWAKSASRE
ncbi:hypothetical protein SHIRM173S_10934 [Streptomyces hirsutus]